jgi:hypothetical protein
VVASNGGKLDLQRHDGGKYPDVDKCIPERLTEFNLIAVDWRYLARVALVGKALAPDHGRVSIQGNTDKGGPIRLDMASGAMATAAIIIIMPLRD